MTADKRRIVHIDLDSFFVSVERLKDSSLYGKPVLIGGSSDRGVVASCSYEARKFGIHSAMPMKTARRLCPHATIIGGDYSAYSKASREVTDIIHATVPLYEKTSIDEFYIDLSGMDAFFDSYKIATDLRQSVIKKYRAANFFWPFYQQNSIKNGYQPGKAQRAIVCRARKRGRNF